MKDQIQTAAASFILLVSILLLFTCSNNPTNEAQKTKSQTEVTKPDQSLPMENKADEFKSEQSKNTHLIVEALNHYSDEVMMNAIAQTYDKSILSQKTSIEIVNEMPAVVKQLKHAELEKIISETPGKVSLKLKKNDTTDRKSVV